jgi:hypothetical protein
MSFGGIITGYILAYTNQTTDILNIKFGWTDSSD